MLNRCFNNKKLRVAALGIVLLMVASLFIGGAQPGVGSLFAAPWDKLVHVMYFLVLASLLLYCVGLPIALVIVISLMIGAADEIHQSMLPGRTAGWDDFLADAIGVGLALAGQIFKHK
jgi:VanZ family protein